MNIKDNIDEIHKYDFEMMLEFKRICDLAKLDYILAYGTLLGALRHKGFIPWDDDVDFAMLRKDYNRFLSVAPTLIDSSRFRIEDIYSMPDNFLPYAKILRKGSIEVEGGSEKLNIHHELSIDIFPIDNVPEDPKLQRKIGKQLYKYYHILSGKVGEKSRSKIKSSLKHMLGVLYPSSRLNLKNKLLSVCRPYEKIDTNLVAVPDYSGNFEKYIFPKQLFTELVEIPFCGELFKAPKDSDKFLKIQYGDYMKLPPENERWNYNHLITKISFPHDSGEKVSQK